VARGKGHDGKWAMRTDVAIILPPMHWSTLIKPIGKRLRLDQFLNMGWAISLSTILIINNVTLPQDCP
jgi:hypothetical protein